MDDSSDDSAATLVEEFDPEAGRPVSVCVVQMVAIASDRRPSDLKSLHRSVDPDALDSLFDSKPARHREGVTRLSFEYSGYEVVITAEEAVTIELEETPGR